MKDVLFSIHVPVYNTEKYLRDCIESVLRQSYSNLELFLVDDGSPDECPRICDEYRDRDDRVHVIHQENKGTLAARRASLKFAKGDYILFLDSDDMLMDGALMAFKAMIDRFGADVIIFGGAVRVKAEVRFKDVKTNALLTGDDRLSVYNALIRYSTTNTLCGKVFRREIIDCDDDYASYGRFLFGEDTIQLFYPMSMAKSIVYTDRELYFYRPNEGSVTHNLRPGFFDDALILIQKKREFMNQLECQGSEFDALFAEYVYDMYATLLKMLHQARAPLKQKRDLLDKLRHSEEFRKNLPKIRRRKLRNLQIWCFLHRFYTPVFWIEGRL